MLTTPFPQVEEQKHLGIVQAQLQAPLRSQAWNYLLIDLSLFSQLKRFSPLPLWFTFLSSPALLFLLGLYYFYLYLYSEVCDIFLHMWKVTYILKNQVTFFFHKASGEVKIWTQNSSMIWTGFLRWNWSIDIQKHKSDGNQLWLSDYFHVINKCFWRDLMANF